MNKTLYQGKRTKQPTIQEGVAAWINIVKTHTEKHEIILELIFSNLVICRYNQKQAENVVR